MTDKRKKKARALSAKTGMSHAAAINALNQNKPAPPNPDDLVLQAVEAAIIDFGGQDDGTFNSAGFALAFAKLAHMRGPLDGNYVRAILSGRPEIVMLSPGNAHFKRVRPTNSTDNFGYHNPNFPLHCKGCGRPLLLENLFVDDGCPCNSPRGINFTPKPCTTCGMSDCVKPGHRIGELWGTPMTYQPAKTEFQVSDDTFDEAVRDIFSTYQQGRIPVDPVLDLVAHDVEAPASRTWTHIGGDLEASYDGSRYVDIRTTTGKRCCFASKETLQKAVGLFPWGANVPREGCRICGGTPDNHYRVRAPGHENDDGDGAPTVPCPNASP